MSTLICSSIKINTLTNLDSGAFARCIVVPGFEDALIEEEDGFMAQCAELLDLLEEKEITPSQAKEALDKIYLEADKPVAITYKYE